VGGQRVEGNQNTGVNTGVSSLAGGFSSTGVTSRNTSVSSSNFLSQFYVNPMSQGVITSNTGRGGASGTGTASVSFGTPLYGNTMGGTGSTSGGFGSSGLGSAGGRASGGAGGFGTTGGRTSGGGTSTFGGSTGGRTGTTGSFGGSTGSGGSTGFGGSTGGFGAGGRSGGQTGFGGSSGFGQMGGFGGATSGFGSTTGMRGGSTSGMGTTGPGMSFGPANGVRTPTVVTTLRFQAPVVAPQVRRDQLQQVFTRSSAFTVPGGVNVTLDGQAIVLRGRVANDDERRLAENMLRLTPGVREIRNELQVPAATPTNGIQ